MAYIINPTAAFLLIFSAVMLLMMSAINPRSGRLKLAMIACLAGAGFEISQVRADPWALIVVALSPLPFLMAIRQPHKYAALVIASILMLTMGSFFLFQDADGHLISIPFDGIIAVICARAIWIMFVRHRDSLPRRINEAKDSVIGLVGTARTAIEKFETGMVEIEGELWSARSDQPIPAGSMVRIVRSDGLFITVEKVENLKK